MRKIEVRNTLITIILLLALITYLSREKYTDKNFTDGILVEVHGMILDFLIVGVFLSLILNYYESKKEINDLLQTIDFNRMLRTEEAKYKIFSAIKSLNEKKITAIKIHQCKLDNIIIPKINLKKATIHATDFSGSNLNGSNLSHTAGEGVRFINSVIRSTNFASSDLYRMEMHETKGKNCDFTQATIIKSNIFNCDLESSDFRYAKIHKTKFTDSNLKSLDFRGADFDIVDFSNCILKNARFQQCTFGNNIIFANADLSKSDFSGHIDLPLENLILARSLRGAIFEDAIRENLQEMGANL